VTYTEAISSIGIMYLFMTRLFNHSTLDWNGN